MLATLCHSRLAGTCAAVLTLLATTPSPAQHPPQHPEARLMLPNGGPPEPPPYAAPPMLVAPPACYGPACPRGEYIDPRAPDPHATLLPLTTDGTPPMTASALAPPPAIPVPPQFDGSPHSLTLYLVDTRGTKPTVWPLNLAVAPGRGHTLYPISMATSDPHPLSAQGVAGVGVRADGLVTFTLDLTITTSASAASAQHRAAASTLLPLNATRIVTSTLLPGAAAADPPLNAVPYAAFDPYNPGKLPGQALLVAAKLRPAAP